MDEGMKKIPSQNPGMKNLIPWKKGHCPNPGGRPKALYEATQAYLKKKGKGGKTNAMLMVESMGDLAQKNYPHSVSAFNALRSTAEPNVGEEGISVDARSLSLTVIQMMQRAAAPQEKQIE